MPDSSAIAESLAVGVRALCEFARRGDIDLRFAMAPTALEGMAGHALVAGRRPAGYEREVSLQGSHAGLLVRGRADGFDPAANALEEIKTHRGDLGRMPEAQRAVHWAQARVYGWLLCDSRGLAQLTLRLVYLDLLSGQETVFEEHAEAATLRAGFEAACAAYADWAARLAAHRRARDVRLGGLAFPFAGFRGAQRRMAVEVYRKARDGGCLALEAPTGIGKTLGTLFPALRALATGLDRVHYLTARTTGRGLALAGLRQLLPQADAGTPRVLELVARDKACLHPEAGCTGARCPLARGFFDRLPAARAEAFAQGWLDKGAVAEIAARHSVCPYFLGQAMIRWSDVVVGDYVHGFDLGAVLTGLAAAEGWRCITLVDEAHNLVERAREMYSARLERAALAPLRRRWPALAGTWRSLARAWSALAAGAPLPEQALEAPPEAFVDAHRVAAAAIGEQLAEGVDDVQLLEFYFAVLHFLRMAERHGPHAMFMVSGPAGPPGRRPLRAQLRNLVPAPLLAPRWAQSHCTVLFSGTLSPANYYADMLGLPAHTARLELDSPFHAGQVDVRVSAGLSTRYADRAASVPAIVDIVGAQYRRRPGNYLVFVSSHAYLEQVHARFEAACPQVPAWRQPAGMDEAARDAFIARFVADGRGVGFAVLGGVFAEGIDLPGSRLIGVFIATLGLPQVNPGNEVLRERLEAMFGAGYDYAYLYPGLRKVVQAAGRVIRTEQDTGVVHLMDERYLQARVRALLPRWWPVPRIERAAARGATAST